MPRAWISADCEKNGSGRSLTPTGAVLGTAEMLEPVSLSQQPFRFVALEHGDRHRLQGSIQSSFGQARHEQEWIEKYRAALDQRQPQRKLFFSTPLAVLRPRV